MDTTPSVSNSQANDEIINEILQDKSRSNEQESTSIPVVQTTERVVTPIQPPIQTGASIRQNLPSGLNVQQGSGNQTFVTLRATTISLAFGYPLAYGRALMQMGYEPLAAYSGKTLFGKEALYYPNAFRYLQYIYRQDGFFGLYRGFGCSLISKAVCVYTTNQVNQILGPVDTCVEQTQPTWNTCIQKSLREVRCQSFGILVSHPFQVMAIRCMGQFVGRENIYSSWNIFQNFREIYERQGIGGFFVGLIPRWLLEVSSIIITNIIIQLLRSQISAHTELNSIYDFLASFVAQTVTYPLSVVTTVTAINHSGIRAGLLNPIPIYANWQDAYSSLSKMDQLKRGSSLFNRAVLGRTGLATLGAPIPNA